MPISYILQLPFTREDLKIRWQMNSRQSVHQVASKPDFPQPVFAFNQRLIEKGALLEKLLDDHGDAAQTEKELQQLLSAENRYQELKQFTSKIKYQDQSTMFQHFVQEIKSR